MSGFCDGRVCRGDRRFHGLGVFIYSGGGSQTRDRDDHASTGARGLRVVHKSKGSATPAENDPFATILLLDPFERFVFVISILEGQSDAECANLLRCSRRDVMIARVLALKRQSSTDALAVEIL